MTYREKKRENGRTEREPHTLGTSLRASAMLLSRREVTVSGCRRITEYSSVRVKLSVCEGTVIIDGRGLTVCTYSGDELTVRGWLSGISFEDNLSIGASGVTEVRS